ncbi:threonine/serine exporter family protein [Limibacter armeniacum]|uniref:threonine/serine exporter family protein n=1 Tax=Limibacter armeniacum TaxID=466084 RepID=UPI002FE6A73A
MLTQQIFFNTFYALIGSLGFSIIFNIRGKHLIFASLGGGISWFCYEIGLALEQSSVVSMFMATCMVTVYSEILARRMKIPATIVIISSVIPLVPGGGMYYTMLESVNGNEVGFLKKLTITLFEAGAIAIGIVLVSSFARILKMQKR